MTWLISRVQVYHQRYHLLVPKSTIQTDIDNLEYYHIDLHIRKIKRSISFEARPVYRCTVYQPQAFVSIEGQSPNFSFTNPRIRRNLRDFNIFDGKWRHENFSVKGFFVEEKLRPKLHNGQTPNTTRQQKHKLSQDTGHFNKMGSVFSMTCWGPNWQTNSTRSRKDPKWCIYAAGFSKGVGYRSKELNLPCS